MLDNYDLNIDGLGYQIKTAPYIYDMKYVEDRYDTYGDLNITMSNLRLGFVVGSLGFVPTSILDIGYGNGAFLKECSKIITNCYGYDISGYPVPEGCKFTENWKTKPVDVITFFDSLEHFDDPYFIAGLPTQHIVISVPFCHSISNNAWFDKWKHRRPNEHRWFFNDQSMKNFAHRCGFEVIASSNIEDAIRKSPDNTPNILTVTLKRIGGSRYNDHTCI